MRFYVTAAGGAVDAGKEGYTLSTKVGRLLVPQDSGGRMDDAFQVPATHRRVWDFSRDGVRRSFEDSLERLGVDQLDKRRGSGHSVGDRSLVGRGLS